eukprot:scaffold58667_cov61-Attheya_sp.AAC.1
MSRNSVGVSSVEMGTVSTNGILALSCLLLDGRIIDEGRTPILEEVFVPLEPATAIGEDALASSTTLALNAGVSAGVAMRGAFTLSIMTTRWHC